MLSAMATGPLGETKLINARQLGVTFRDSRGSREDGGKEAAYTGEADGTLVDNDYLGAPSCRNLTSQ